MKVGAGVGLTVTALLTSLSCRLMAGGDGTLVNPFPLRMRVSSGVVTEMGKRRLVVAVSPSPAEAHVTVTVSVLPAVSEQIHGVMEGDGGHKQIVVVSEAKGVASASPHTPLRMKGKYFVSFTNHASEPHPTFTPQSKLSADVIKITQLLQIDNCLKALIALKFLTFSDGNYVGGEGIGDESVNDRLEDAFAKRRQLVSI